MSGPARSHHNHCAELHRRDRVLLVLGAEFVVRAPSSRSWPGIRRGALRHRHAEVDAVERLSDVSLGVPPGGVRAALKTRCEDRLLHGEYSGGSMLSSIDEKLLEALIEDVNHPHLQCKVSACRQEAGSRRVHPRIRPRLSFVGATRAEPPTGCVARVDGAARVAIEWHVFRRAGRRCARAGAVRASRRHPRRPRTRRGRCPCPVQRTG